MRIMASRYLEYIVNETIDFFLIRVLSRNSRLSFSDYGTKYPEISITTCVGFDPKMLIDPFAAGTIARLEVIAPSMAFRVEASGCVEP
jgi:hypothetical protein